MPKEYIEREALIKSIVNSPSVACQSAWETGAHTFTETLNRLAERQHEIIDMITAAQAADVVEVVRCGECKFHTFLGHCEVLSTEPDEYGCGAMVETLPSDYCSYGERKDMV